MTALHAWEKSYPASLRNYEIPAELLTGNLTQFSAQGAEQYPDSTAFTVVLPNGLQHSLTFKQVDELSNVFSRFLVAQGLQAGDVVALQLPTSLHYPIAVLGAWKAGLIVTNMNPLYTAREVALQIEDSKAKLLIAADLFAHSIQTVVQEYDLQLVLTSMGDFFPEPIGQMINQHLGVKLALDGVQYQYFMQALRSGEAVPETPHKTHPVALYQYTGGTTGRSKGAPLTHSNLLAVLEMAQAYVNAYKIKIERGEVILTALPLYHIFAFNFNFLLFFKLGCRNILVPNPRPLSNLQPAFKQFKIGWITGVDTLYAGLLAEPWFTKELLHLKYVVSGGTALRPSTALQWQERVCPILEGYGLTETSCFVSLNPPTATVQLGYVGLPLPACEVRIVGEDGHALPFDQAGELAVRGPHVVSEYLNQPQETAASMRDGWFYTGDMAVMDERGFLQIVDRKKDIILVSGFNVYPNEVEGVIAEHPDVLEVAVIGRADASSGEAVYAYICVRNTANVTAETIIAHCRQYLTAYKVPKHIEFRAELPKSPVGKILRAQLRDLQSTKQTVSPAQGQRPQAVTQALAQWHSMVAQGDLSALPSILHQDVVFRSPVAHTPYSGAPVVALILSTVAQVFTEFTYLRELATEDGLSVVLEFSAHVNGKQLKGIDMLRFDQAGKIVEFEVMLRPLNALQTLAAEMAQRLAAYLPSK